MSWLSTVTITPVAPTAEAVSSTGIQIEVVSLLNRLAEAKYGATTVVGHLTCDQRSLAHPTVLLELIFMTQ